MKFLGNIIWFLFGGFIAAIEWFVAGLLLCLTIIGIPMGIQCMKIAGLVMWPFGKEVKIGKFGVGGLILNIIWLIIFGLELALSHLIFGLICCVTIIGIPFDIQHFKLAKLGLMPFGAKIY